MIDVTKASRETRDEVCSELERSGLAATLRVGHPLITALAKLRAECAPKLRSREQVDFERHQVEHAMANILFGCPSSNAWNLQSARPYNFAAQVPSVVALQDLKERWLDLCKEAVAAPHHDEPTAEEPAELDLAEHEVEHDTSDWAVPPKPCSCEEAEGLKARIAELEQQVVHWQGVSNAHLEQYNRNVEILAGNYDDSRLRANRRRQCLADILKLATEGIEP